MSGINDTIHNSQGTQMDTEIKRLTSRHIAKCLSNLGDTVAPIQIASIKRSFRWLEKDIVTLVTNGEHNELSSNDMGIPHQSRITD